MRKAANLSYLIHATTHFTDEETEAHELYKLPRVTELGTSRGETGPRWRPKCSLGDPGCSPGIGARSFPAALPVSSEALLIPQRPQGRRDQIPSSDSQMMPCSPSAPRKI